PLRGDLHRVFCVSLRLCAVDGVQLVALRRSHRGSVLPASRGQHLAVRRPRCEFEDVLGLAAIRLFPAPVLVDQGPVSRLYFTVADSGSAGRYLFPLVATATGFDRWLVVCAIRYRGSHLVQ